MNALLFIRLEDLTSEYQETWGWTRVIYEVTYEGSTFTRLLRTLWKVTTPFLGLVIAYGPWGAQTELISSPTKIILNTGTYIGRLKDTTAD